MARIDPAIEDNFFDAKVTSSLANCSANRSCLGGFVFTLDLVVEFRLKSRRRGQRPTHGVINDLRVDVLKAAKDRQARALGRPFDLAPDAVMPPHPLFSIG